MPKDEEDVCSVIQAYESPKRIVRCASDVQMRRREPPHRTKTSSQEKIVSMGRKHEGRLETQLHQGSCALA